MIVFYLTWRIAKIALVRLFKDRFNNKHNAMTLWITFLCIYIYTYIGRQDKILKHMLLWYMQVKTDKFKFKEME